MKHWLIITIAEDNMENPHAHKITTKSEKMALFKTRQKLGITKDDLFEERIFMYVIEIDKLLKYRTNLINTY